MKFKPHTLEELETKRSRLSSRFGVIGFDGFIDTIVLPVAQRFGNRDDFAPIDSIGEFAKRIERAAGKSTNIEVYPRMEKLGGNGPIMAHAMRVGGLKLRYIGALGKPNIHPVFADLAAQTDAISLCEPGATMALEFGDGKIMLCMTSSLEEISYESIVATMGEGKFFDLISRTDFIGMVNWTMIPQMTDIFNAFLDRVLPNLPASNQRTFFFDLADPEKRSDSDVISALYTIKRFQSHGKTILGMNLKEAQKVAVLLGIPEPEKFDEEGLKHLASRIRQELNISIAVVHPRDAAACATREDAWWVPGPYTEKPAITTGAGDHFNSGFSLGQLMGLSPLASLTVGVCSSGLYVRNARSPTLNDIDYFLRNWK
ncbi:MAG: carbohydrate kinase family protein [Opitutales bacterium]